MNDKTKAKELKTVDDLGAVTLDPASHHVLTYAGTEGGSLSVTRADKNDGDVTVLIDGKPKTLKAGDTHEGSSLGKGTVEVASTSGGDFTLNVKAAKAAKEEPAAKAGK